MLVASMHIERQGYASPPQTQVASIALSGTASFDRPSVFRIDLQMDRYNVGVIGLASGCRAVTVSRGYQHVYRYQARRYKIKCNDSGACKLCMRRDGPRKIRSFPISTGPAGRSVCESLRLYLAYIEFVQ